MTNRFIKPLLPVLLLCAAVSTGRAEENKISKAADKAAAQLLGSMKDYFTDLTDVQAMTPQQKVDYILKKAETRIKEKTEETAKAALQQKLEDYAEKVLTARAVKDIAIPQMLTAIHTGIPYDAALMDAKVADATAKNMKALTTGIEGAKVTWEVMRKTRDEGPLEGFKELSATIYDKVAEAYIPGYSWVKLGAELTKALVSYVMGYATETAKMAMFSVMYPEYAASPENFGKWLLKTSEREIGLDVARRWDEEGVEFAQYLWEGKGTDSGAVQMRARLRDFLFTMRREIDAKTRKQREAQAKMEERLQKAADDVNKAKTALREASRQALAASEEKLRKLEEFKGTYLGYSAAKELAEEVAEETGKAQVSARASYFEFGLKLDDMQEEIRGKYFGAPWTATRNPDVQTYYDRVDAEWENVKKRYAAQGEQFRGTYGSKSDSVSMVTLGVFNNETIKYQELSHDEYRAITAQVKHFIGLLDAESKATERPLATEVTRVANVLRKMVNEGVIPGSSWDVEKAADSPEYGGIGRLDFPKDALPEPRLRPGQAAYFDLYRNTLNDRANAITIKAGELKYKIEDFDYVLRQVANSAATKKELEENLADIAAIEARISQAELPLHLIKIYLYPDPGLKAEEVGYDQLFRASALSGAKSQNAFLTAELAKAVAVGDRIKVKRDNWQADFESMVADIARLRKQAALLTRGEAAIAEAAAKLSKKRTRDYTEYCSPQAPKDYFAFNSVKEPSCSQLMTESGALMNQGEAQTARSGLVGAARASGLFALDTQYNLGLETFVAAMAEDYFKDVYLPKNYIFIPFEKKCCFYTADYFTGEAAKMRGLKIESDDSAEGALFRGRLVGKLDKSAAYDYVGMWGEDLVKADTARFITLTRGAFDTTVKQGIQEFCSAIDALKADYTEYLRQQAADAVYDKEANALSVRIRAAETEANTKLDTASWEKVAAFETEVLAFEVKYKAADISAGMKVNLGVNVDSMKTRIATAKQNTKLVISDKPSLPDGPADKPQPQGPSDKPSQPTGPVGKPPFWPKDKPWPPAGPTDKPAPPEAPVEKPVPPVDKPVPPADKPLPPVDKPIPPADKPVTPADKPMPPADKPVPPADKPVPPADKPVPPVDKPLPPVDKPIPPPDKPVTPVDKPLPPADKPVPPADKPALPVDKPQPPADKPDVPVKPVNKPDIPVAPPAKPADKPIGPEKPRVVPTTMDPNIGAIEIMYAEFKRAYEAKNESQVLRYISADWDAGDGTSMSELSGYLRNIFTVFNEVRCTITGLRVIKKADGAYKTTYTMTITGRIFDQNIKHEEKSSVEEEVSINERGKPVIAKTMKGNFWYFE